MPRCCSGVQLALLIAPPLPSITILSLTTKRLHRLEFVPESADDDPFGFVDPSDVLRGCHIIPAFVYGQTDELLRPSLVRNEHGSWDKLLKPDMDYRYYYVNMLVPFLSSCSPTYLNDSA